MIGNFKFSIPKKYEPTNNSVTISIIKQIVNTRKHAKYLLNNILPLE